MIIHETILRGTQFSPTPPPPELVYVTGDRASRNDVICPALRALKRETKSGYERYTLGECIEIAPIEMNVNDYRK